MDPTIQQYAEIPDSALAMLPLVARLPAWTGLGNQPFAVDRVDQMVVYLPVPEHQRQAWRNPVTDSRVADYRTAGANLAANVFAMLRLENFRSRAARSPYPRLRKLLSALDGTEIVADSQGFRFAGPETGTEMRLADVP